jgi:hypothetical protein
MSEVNEFKPKLFNPYFNSFAEWNGSAWEDKKIPSAYFYGQEKAANNGYHPVESCEEAAVMWYNLLTPKNKQQIFESTSEKMGVELRWNQALTPKEIQILWEANSPRQNALIFSNNQLNNSKNK